MKFVVCHQSCQSDVVKKLLSTKKRINLFSLFRRENSSMRFSDLPLSHRQHKVWVCGYVSTQSLITKSCWWERVINQKQLSTTSCVTCLQPKICNYCSIYIYICTHIFFDKKLRSSLNTESFLIFLLFSQLHFYCNQVLYFYCSQVESWVH